MTKDPDYLDKVQKAIVEKYGEETVESPRANWTRAKELEYLKELRKKSQNENLEEEPEDKVEVDGVLIPKKLFTKETDRVCTSCGGYSFNIRDDLYMTKFRCCFKCFVQYVEGREERWLSKLTENE